MDRVWCQVYRLAVVISAVLTQLTAGVEARAPQAKIENPDIGTAFADEFGIGLSLWKETVAIGVPSDGDVHVYVNVGGHWIQQARLGGLETYSGSNSSLAVGLYEDTLVAGSRMGDGGAINAGGAVVFTRNGDTWTSRATLLPGDPVRSGQVGGSVGLWGDTAILGTSDLAATPPGRAYVFHRVGEAWTQQAKLLPDDLEAGDFFGWSVAIHADTAIVGAHYGDSATSNNGSAYIFERSGGIWTQVAKLVPPDPDVFDQFGYSVAIHGDRAVVGSVNGDSPVLNSGTAHVYRRDGGAWVEEATLAPPDPAGPIAFGLGVAIWGDTIAVGAPSDDSGATNAGAVYIYRREGTQWRLVAKHEAEDFKVDSGVGVRVAIYGNRIAASAPYKNDPELHSGAVYIFEHAAPGETAVRSGWMMHE